MDEKICKAAKYLAETVVASLQNVMEKLTVVLFEFNRQKDRAKKSKARMKAIEEHHKLREENEEIQKRIAKEGGDDREAIAKGKLPKQVKDQIIMEAKAQAKAYIVEFKKKEQVKYLGGRQNQTLKPRNNGTDSEKRSD